jgi:hypothetical protein
MGEFHMGKYDKYICTELFKKNMLPGPSPEEREKLAAEGLRISMEHILWIDDEIIPGAYYGESTWIWPSSYPNQISKEEQLKRTTNPKPMFPHVHDFPELLSWWGSDPEHPEKTRGMGMLMGDYEIPLGKSWIAYIPAGLKHMPTRPQGAKEADIPVVHWTFGPGEYTREKENKPEASTQTADIIFTEDEIKNFFVYGYNDHIKRPAYMCDYNPKYIRPAANINEDIIPGSELGCEIIWILPGERQKSGQVIIDKHKAPHGTHIVLQSMNYNDITDLDAEVELWIGGEKHLINKSFGAYIPPDVECGPLIVRNVRRQMFLMIAFPVGEGLKKYRGR